MLSSRPKLLVTVVKSVEVVLPKCLNGKLLTFIVAKRAAVSKESSRIMNHDAMHSETNDDTHETASANIEVNEDRSTPATITARASENELEYSSAK